MRKLIVAVGLVVIGVFVTTVLIRGSGDPVVTEESSPNLKDMSQEALLDELSGNKGYDDWSQEQKNNFEADQLEALEKLQKKNDE